MVNGFERIAGKRAVSLDFGTELNWLAVSPKQALVISRTIRQRIHNWFGPLPYTKQRLTVQVIGNREKNMVECVLPTPTTRLIANPEMFLAWADQMTTTAMSLLKEESK